LTERQADFAIIAGIALVILVIIVYFLVGTGFVTDRGEPTNDNDQAAVTATADDDEQDTAEATPESDPAPEPTPTPELSAASGTITSAETGDPLAGVQIEAVIDGEVVATTETDAEGQFSLSDLPPDATIVFVMAMYAPVERSLADGTEFDIAMEPSSLAGRVVAPDGQPIFEATVAAGDEIVRTAEDGSFEVDNQGGATEVIVKAPGYAAEVIPITEIGDEITLAEKPIYGIYAPVGLVGDNERFQETLDMIDRTELNAIVIDIKDSGGVVFHNTDVQMAHDIDAVWSVYDPEYVLSELRARDIYAIARIVIFEDPKLAEARPDLAIQDTQEGGLWRTWMGLAWANPFMEEVWQYNIDLMVEAVELGFDEVQLDYMRFPSDGPLNRAGYGGQESTPESRDATIAAFLERAYQAIGPTTAYITGDIFGLTLWDPGESDIGQNLVTVTEHLDYVHPMIYPSHFYEGSMGFEVPNDHPYEVINLSLENGMRFLPEHFKPRIRPWLQDFSYGVGINYGPNEVRAQIQASRDFGASGWMLWNAAGSYHEEALDPAQ
jgi:hypothetical protein